MAETREQQALETEKLRVETEKLRVETDKLKAELGQTNAQVKIESDKAVQEVAKLRAEADKTQAEALLAMLHANKEKRAEEKILAQDSYHHVYRFSDSVNSSSVSNCLKQLAEWDRLEPDCDVTIVWTSPGGSVIDGMSLFDSITAMSKRGGGNHHVTMVVRGWAASMAGILLQAADKRVIGPESYLMIHEIAAGTGGKIGEIKDDVKFYETICERVVNIFVNRAGGKISKATFKRNWNRQDWFLDSEHTLKYGFADEIG